MKDKDFSEGLVGETAWKALGRGCLKRLCRPHTLGRGGFGPPGLDVETFWPHGLDLEPFGFPGFDLEPFGPPTWYHLGIISELRLPKE